MSDYGLAAIKSTDPNDPGVGWALTATGQIQRATGAADRALRLLRPLFGPVWSEPHRGTAPRPTKMVDTMPVIVRDRARLVLGPMLDTGEIAIDSLAAAPTAGNSKFMSLGLRGRDAQQRVVSLSEFVRIGP